MNYKEYSRLRSIARKRIERASAAGAAEYTRIPTVAEVRAIANPEQYMSAVKEFLSKPSLRAVKKADSNLSFPRIELAPTPPVTSKKRSEADRIARRRESSRRSKAKKAVVQAAGSEAEARKKVGYLKALETVAAKWREVGIDAGNWLGVLSPKKARQFTEYMEYRFSQGDYNAKYVIDTFIRDFGELVKRDYNLDDIQQDFGNFMENQKRLEKNKKRTNKYGITEDFVTAAWQKFIKGSM